MSFINSTSKKTAALLSYVNQGLSTLVAIFLTPILLKYLGVDEYGLYQMVYSVGHYIMILDLGIGAVMIRYISEYRARKDKVAEENFAAIIAFFTVVISILVFSAGEILNLNIENIFQNLSTSDYDKAHKMFNLMVIQFVFTVIDHYFYGIIGAYERFVFSRTIGILRLVISFILNVLFVILGFGAVGLVMTNTITIVSLTLVNVWYVFKQLHFKIHFHQWDFILVKPAIGLMLAMLLQSVVGFVNSSADKTILGIMCTKSDVAVYSIAASIITLFNTLPTVISGLFQPQVTKMVVHGASKSQLTDLVIRVGRWQFMLCGLLLFGLAFFGMDFLHVWVGHKLTHDQEVFTWIIMMVILPFNMIPLVQTVCISILNAYDKRLYRSIILAGMCVINIIVSVILVKLFGPIGCPIGTALSFLIGYAIILNIYYSKGLQLEVVRMFKEIMSKTWICLLLTALLTSPLLLWKHYTIPVLLLKIVIFSIVFMLLMWLFGFNEDEKNTCKPVLKKLHLINNQ